MAFDTIKSGLKVVTRIGRQVGNIQSVVRHPVTRKVLAVIVAPEGGSGDPMDNIVTSARNLRPAV